MTREEIITAIQTCASKLGRIPTSREFLRETRTSRHCFYRHFSGIIEAVRAAGLEPNPRGRRLESPALLLDWARVARKLGRLPSSHHYLREGRYNRSTMNNHFGGWRQLPWAFERLVREDTGSLGEDWKDVLALIQEKQNQSTEKKARQPLDGDHADRAPVRPDLRTGAHLDNLLACASGNPVWRNLLKDRPVLGHPLRSSCPELEAMLCEPVNEAGVFFLFALVARRLGFRVEALQSSFPDCEARREIQPGRWQRLRIEIEYESLNFVKHRHDPATCDVIVCWRHNWPDCPKNIEVIELSKIIAKM